MKKVRAVNKAKLASLEWSDEAIQDVNSKSGSNTSTLSMNAQIINSNVNGTNGVPFVDTQEDKIARVEMRKKEGVDRLKKRSYLPPPPARPESVLTKFSHPKKKASKFSARSNNYTPEDSDDTVNSAGQLADALNIYFNEHIREHSNLISSYESNFPLPLFDSSIYDETLTIDGLDLSKSVVGAVLMCMGTVKTGEEDRVPGVGTWYSCRILAAPDLSIDGPEGEMIKVEIPGLIIEDVQFVPRMNVVLLHPPAVRHHIDLYADRITEVYTHTQYTTIYTMHYTLCTIHYTLYTVHCTLSYNSLWPLLLSYNTVCLHTILSYKRNVQLKFNCSISSILLIDSIRIVRSICGLTALYIVLSVSR